MKVYLVVFDSGALKLSKNIMDNIREYVDDNYVSESEIANSRRARFNRREHEENLRLADRNAEQPRYKKPSPKTDIASMVANADKTFQEKLFEIIDERGLTGPQVYTNYVSKQVYSKLQSDMKYIPNKYTTLALCLSLHLSLEETQDMIGRAGYALSPSAKADIIVRACIVNKIYNIVQINIALNELGCAELKYI